MDVYTSMSRVCIPICGRVSLSKWRPRWQCRDPSTMCYPKLLAYNLIQVIILSSYSANFVNIHSYIRQTVYLAISKWQKKNMMASNMAASDYRWSVIYIPPVLHA